MANRVLDTKGWITCREIYRASLRDEGNDSMAVSSRLVLWLSRSTETHLAYTQWSRLSRHSGARWHLHVSFRGTDSQIGGSARGMHRPWKFVGAQQSYLSCRMY